MFSLPVGENIAASSAVDEERAWEVLDQVELSGRVRAMKDGLKTQLYNNNGAGVDVSGGEAQRLKLASEMGRTQSDALFVFDEPTIGLHPLDVRTLLDVFRTLVDNGASVVVIEHDLDVLRNADHIIDMGPKGGAEGGRIVACGTPAQIRSAADSETGRYL